MPMKFEDIKSEEDLAVWEAESYGAFRKTEYPTIEDQLDYIFHNGIDKWKEDMIQPVKAKYPKS